MSKNINMIGCSSCERFNKQLTKTNSSGSDKKVSNKVVVPRKVLISKHIHSGGHLHGKSCSASVVSNNKNFSTKKYKKTTKSDVSFDINKTDNPLDYCKKCGDSLEKQSLTNNKPEIYIKPKKATNTRTYSKLSKLVKNNNTEKKAPNYVQQYYKNENFCLSTESVNTGQNVKRISSLDTIKEVPEIRTTEESIFRVNTESESESENECLDTDNEYVIRKLKEFRRNNYFECHSAKSRITHKPSVTVLKDHKCVYRFYLNERLFPVPLNRDFNNRIRCVECHLPMDLVKDDSEKINGTIQAKVRLGDEVKDLMLLLPAREPLIIKEKRKEDRVEHEEIYFGIIKLNSAGQSVFNNATFDESLALRYQKGFRQFKNGRTSYKPMEDNDVVFI